MSAKFLFLLLFAVGTPLYGQVPQFINFQAQLSGLPDGTVGITFSLFDNEAGEGEALWSEPLPVQINQGAIHAKLGAVSNFPEDLFINNSGLFLQLTVDGEVVTPLYQFLSVPFAMRASYADRIAQEDPTLQQMQQFLVPEGAVMAFDLETCPTGWQALESARGRMVVGVGEGEVDDNGQSLTARSLGDTGGEEAHIITVDEMPSHSHGLPRALNELNNNYIRGVGEGGEGVGFTYSINSGITGGNQPHNNMPPYLGLLYCRKN